MSRKWILVTVWIISIGLFAKESVFACTYFFLKAKDGSIISGRTDEFYDEMGCKLEVVPQGMEFTGLAPKGAKAISWKNKYGFVGISMSGNYFGDGMNEEGLATGGLWLEDAIYPSVEPGETVIGLNDVIAWILGNFRTVEEVKAGLSTVKLWVDEMNLLDLKIKLPMHLYVTDAKGDSIVVEWLDGKLKIWDNKENGVMANEPNLGWHLDNLHFFSHINPHSQPVPSLNDQHWAWGTGLLGLPGDYTSASRFVKISLLKYFSQTPKDARDGVNLALHLINTIDIPYGPQIWPQGQTEFVQWTVWSVIYDQTHKYFYYRTYQNPTLRRIELAKLSLGKNGKRARFELFDGESFVDDTARFISTK